jgi:hypothetical protein
MDLHAQTPPADPDLILVVHHHRFGERHFQAAPGALQGDRSYALLAEQDQAIIRRYPQPQAGQIRASPILPQRGKPAQVAQKLG